MSKKVSAAYSILVLEATAGEHIARKTQAVTQSQTPKEIFTEETSPFRPQPQPPQVFLTPPPAPRVSPPCSDWCSTRRGGCFPGRLPVPRPSPSSAGADTKHAIAIPCFCTSQLGFSTLPMHQRSKSAAFPSLLFSRPEAKAAVETTWVKLAQLNSVKQF